jgi:hypothetical protein
MRTRSRRAVAAVAGLGMAFIGGLWAQTALAVTIEQPVTAKMVIMTQAGATGGCHGSIFAVVPDLPDAAVYRVTLHRTDGDQTGVVEFNRHERGSLQFTSFPKWSPGGRQIAGLLTWGSLDGAGDDCAAIRADYEARFSITGANVVRYTPTEPAAKAAAYEVKSVATLPPNDGIDGKDGCATYQWVTAPLVKGAVTYRIKVVESIVGVLRTNNLVLTPAQMNGKPPAGVKAAPYKSAGRLGYWYAFQQRDGRGCRYAEWQIATAVKSVKLVKVDKR